MRLGIAIIFLPILALAQGRQSITSSDQKVFHYINAYISADGGSASPEKFLSFLNKLSEKREKFKNDKVFLDHVFTKTHQHILKEYKDYATFSQLINKGQYNCLTATGLYALILEHFDFTYDIIETNYHIFLLAETSSGSVLFEATDPLYGFITDENEIGKKILKYKSNDLANTSGNKTYYHYNSSIYDVVDLHDLLGLLHYNMAVEAYNKKDLTSAIVYLEKACLLYESQRLQEFCEVIFLTVLESKIQPGLKQELLQKIQSIRRNKPGVTASAKTY